MSDELQQSIQDNAEGPAKVAGDAGSVEQHKLQDQIAADRYLNGKKAAQAKGLGVRLGKVIPPGAA